VRLRPLAGTCALLRWTQLLVLSLGILAVVTAGVLFSSPLVAAGADLSSGVAHPLPAADEDGEEDPFAVSDNDLAVAIFVPGIFVAATVLMLFLAVKGRVKKDEDGDSEPD
jgi:hypothetical protein